MAVTPPSSSSNDERERVVVAAATAGEGGGWMALRAVLQFLNDGGYAAEVWLPKSFPSSILPTGPTYRAFGRATGVLRELIGPSDAPNTRYVGMSDRLPLVRRPRSCTLVLQNPFLYGPPKRDFPVRTRVRLALLRIWCRSSARRADLVVSATAASVADFVRTTGVDPQRVLVRPIPPQDLTPPRRVQPAEVRRIVMVGTIFDYKRFDWAIGMLDRWAAERDRTIDLVHIGGAEEAAAEKSVREAATSARHIDVQLRGRADHEATIAEMADADLLLFPSARESFGLPLAEALGLGVPAVCTDLPQFREIAGTSSEYFVDEATFFSALDRVQSVLVRENMASTGGPRVDANGGWDVVPPASVTASETSVP